MRKSDILLDCFARKKASPARKLCDMGMLFKNNTVRTTTFNQQWKFVGLKLINYLSQFPLDFLTAEHSHVGPRLINHIVILKARGESLGEINAAKLFELISLVAGFGIHMLSIEEEWLKLWVHFKT